MPCFTCCETTEVAALAAEDVSGAASGHAGQHACTWAEGGAGKCSLDPLASATNLKKLTMVEMDFNNLSGNLSAACTLNARSKLQQLSLGSNAVNGSIPPCLTASSALVELRLDHNRLSGSIPSLAANSSLVYLTAGNQAGLL